MANNKHTFWRTNFHYIPSLQSYELLHLCETNSYFLYLIIVLNYIELKILW